MRRTDRIYTDSKYEPWQLALGYAKYGTEERVGYEVTALSIVGRAAHLQLRLSLELSEQPRNRRHAQLVECGDAQGWIEYPARWQTKSRDGGINYPNSKQEHATLFGC